jgi:hypothetical protein
VHDLTRPSHRVPYPWRDVRLWAGPLLMAGVAGLANLAWAGFVPGRSGPTWAVAAAAAGVALAGIGVALHPRARRWTAEGNVVPSVVALIAAAAVVAPALGPELLGYLWTAGCLLFVWSKTKDLVRSAVRLALVLPDDRAPGAGTAHPAPRPVPVGEAPFATLVARAVLDALLGAAAWTALCDLGAAGAAPGGGAVAFGGPARLALAAAAAGSALALAAWTGRAAELRRAAGEGAEVQRGFSRLWWWAVAPAVALCLGVAAVLPPYPAPLERQGLARLILAYAELWTGTGGQVPLGAVPTPEQVRAQDRTALALAVICLAAVLLAWPLRRPLERLWGGGADPEDLELEPLGWRDRLRLWWGRLWERWWGWWGRRQAPVRTLRPWRPLGVPAGSGPRDPAWPQRRVAATDDLRGRVRAAYANVLREARLVGLGRRASDTPRRYLGWLLPRARPARFPLESLTAVYEVARFSTHPVTAEDAERAEGDARAASYGLHVAVAERRRQAGEPAPERGLVWTPPRGVRWRGWGH